MPRPRRLALVLVPLLLLGCSSARTLEADGDFPGLAAGVERAGGLDILLVHGMGGYSRQDPETLIAGFEKAFDVQACGEPLHEEFQEGLRYFGRLKRHVLIAPDGSRRVDVWVFYWTGVTQPIKDLYLGFDADDETCARRIEINDALKARLINKNMADTALYFGRHGEAMRSGLVRVVRKIVEEAGDERPIGVVTYSLGGRLVLDTIGELAASEVERDRQVARAFVDRLQGYYMLANQFALLEMRSFDYETGAPDGCEALTAVFSPELTVFDRLARERDERLPGREPVTLVAVSDPNDLLSFGIPDYIRQAFPGRFANVWVSIAQSVYWIPFVGSMVSPDRAHTGYSLSPDVIGLITQGSAWFEGRDRAASVLEEFDAEDGYPPVF